MTWPTDATDPSGLADYGPKFLGTLDPEVQNAINQGGWQIHHSAQQGSVTSQTLANRLLANGFDVHDPSNLYAVPRHVHSDITQAQQSWWAEQMKINGWTTREEAFRRIDLDIYREFEIQLRKDPAFAPYMLGQKSTLCDLNRVRNNLGLPDWVPGKRNPGVASKKIVDAWKRGSAARQSGVLKRLGIAFGIVTVFAKLAQAANAAEIMFNIANPDEATAQAFTEFQGRYNTVLQQRLGGGVNQSAWDDMVWAFDKYLALVGAPDTFRGYQVRQNFGGPLDPTR